MTATWLAWLQAKWALINTRRLAMAFASGRESASRAQAFGLVSRIIVRRVGGGSRPGELSASLPLRLVVFSLLHERKMPDHQRFWYNDRIRRHYPSRCAAIRTPPPPTTPEEHEQQRGLYSTGRMTDRRMTIPDQSH
jgi:hypothetical protein